MARTLSIDLAYTSYEKFGICFIDGVGRPPWKVKWVKPSQIGLTGDPAPAACAAELARFCAAEAIDILILDGPQGWKDPSSPHPHCRICERELRCPAKTGVEGKVKPANYSGFVEFSIGLFTTLENRWGMSLLTRTGSRPRAGVLLVESFPHAAWKGLGLPPIPAKHRCTPEKLDVYAELLFWRLGIDSLPHPSHDELQALAAGVTGPAILGNPPGEVSDPPQGYRMVGVDPVRGESGAILEGLIAVPALFESAPVPIPSKLSRRLG